MRCFLTKRELKAYNIPFTFDIVTIEFIPASFIAADDASRKHKEHQYGP